MFYTRSDTGFHDQTPEKTFPFTEDIILELVHNVTVLLKEEFPDIVVYPALGNHDYYPKGDLPIGTNMIYTELGKLWESWLPQSAIDSITSGR